LLLPAVASVVDVLEGVLAERDDPEPLHVMGDALDEREQ
jgi:hypothetical protein